MGLGRGPLQLLIPLLLLLTILRWGTGLERISYVPRLADSSKLEGKVTQSTFTLEQPRGQFGHRDISDSDAIWLVVARSDAIRNFTAPQSMEGLPAPADLPGKGYYLTLRAHRALYSNSQAHNQLQVLRVGNDTHCAPNKTGCNHPLPGPGPYRVKFLVMNQRGPVAETEWSDETRLQRVEVLQGTSGVQSAGTVVIIAFLSLLLAVFLATLLVLLVYTCFDTCGSTRIAGPTVTEYVSRYSAHQTASPAPWAPAPALQPRL
ncbi:uroplakin-3b-like protein 2 [Echinops telfairi]|uniref:Uroplakin-3b-like protein 2 n=1 Tax=Echinops telfairi TaxID=9371 RepID=A0ABM0IRH6_ECHTE|nr:uroplakin-3b-like protein 2 [Echinops telfairi]